MHAATSPTGCPVHLGYTYYWVSGLVWTILPLGVTASWDMSSPGCLDQLGQSLNWIFGRVGTFLLLRVRANWEISSVGCIGQLGHSSVESPFQNTAMHESTTHDQ